MREIRKAPLENQSKNYFSHPLVDAKIGEFKQKFCIVPRYPPPQMCNYKKKNDNITMENPDRDYINQVIKVKSPASYLIYPSVMHREGLIISLASSPITYKLMDHEKTLHRPK